MEQRILIIEDEERIQTLLKTYLEADGYKVDLASDGLEGMKQFQKDSYQLILLDVMMPQIDGYAVLEMIRQTSNIPVMMITARDKKQDQIKAFDLQADDYIIKPFTMEIVLGRINAVLRRSQTNQDTQCTPLKQCIVSYQNLSLNIESFEVFLSGEIVKTTKKEFELLKVLLTRPKQIFTREILFDEVWGYQFRGNLKVVNAHIQNLRKKLGGQYIETIHGMGYRLYQTKKK